jgi:ribosomal protein L11 methylase PrmA
VEFRRADFRQDAGLESDVVVANLTGGMLAAGAADLARAVASGGALILSGITSEERAAVLHVFERGFRLEWRAEEEGWCCALLRKCSSQ